MSSASRTSAGDAARELVRRTTATQHLPEVVKDAGALARVAAILASSRNGNGAPKGAGTCSHSTTDLTRAGDLHG